MEVIVALCIGAMTASGVYLILRARTFPVLIGIAMLSYAVNVYLFVTGAIVANRPPVLSDGAAGYTDPLPQALVLTAIVISFGMSAVIAILALRAFLETGDDAIDVDPPSARDGEGRA